MKNFERDKIIKTLNQHERWRKESLNLVAAENSMSPLARSVLASELEQRYGDYTGRDLHDRRYFGTRYIIDLEVEIAKLASKVFNAKFVELRPLSGHIAGDCVIMALCNPGDTVMELGRYDGGHRIATKLNSSPLIDIKVEYLPFDASNYNIDIEKTVEIVKEKEPRLIILGSSNFLYPIPLRELAYELRGHKNTILAYDASHVLGLISGGLFQAPLEEGADLVLGGTQKSFPGPQGGIVYSNNESLIGKISSAVYPAVISNHHLARLPSLGIALAEMKHWGNEYAAKVIKNAQALAKALVNSGIPVVNNGKSYTESHTVMMNTSSLYSNKVIGRDLEKAGIITSASRLPKTLGEEAIRLGTNELTRRGANESDMNDIGKLISELILKKRTIEDVKADVVSLSKNFMVYEFTWTKFPLYEISPKGG